MSRTPGSRVVFFEHFPRNFGQVLCPACHFITGRVWSGHAASLWRQSGHSIIITRALEHISLDTTSLQPLADKDISDICRWYIIIRGNINCTEKNGEGEEIIDCLDMMRRVRGYIIAYHLLCCWRVHIIIYSARILVITRKI